ncbi:hypothetical protein RFI_18376 [Reticulomyxa filosa]|uniref:VHS domain-containing protein n=1 Tax=Reticulomyxa filosa TaxID=46433 RepID=X6MZ37_RETFI|nr:hypothetical protein RFI_18376 [Reticulomyxa filosa]|eukprot:ETO18868.1 hypothetical protein RFI_18376 [Reticulomyxa filosa]
MEQKIRRQIHYVPVCITSKKQKKNERKEEGVYKKKGATRLTFGRRDTELKQIESQLTSVMSVSERADPLGNRYESQKQKLVKSIKEACSEYRNTPDWTKNMEIIDELNRLCVPKKKKKKKKKTKINDSNTHLCGFAMQEIRQLLKTKNPEIEILALTLTEGVIKNCPASHAAVAQKDFMRYLVKVALNQRKDGFWKGAAKKLTFKKEVVINKDHVRAQTIDKALLLLRMLNDAYKNTHLYPIFHNTFKVAIAVICCCLFELEKQGIRFPEPNKDEDMKIFTDTKSSEEFSGMGSVPKTKSDNSKRVFVDRTLPMIRPVVKLSNVTNPGLNQAQVFISTFALSFFFPYCFLQNCKNK